MTICAIVKLRWIFVLEFWAKSKNFKKVGANNAKLLSFPGAMVTSLSGFWVKRDNGLPDAHFALQIGVL